MSEFESKEMSLEIKLSEIKRLAMEQLGLTSDEEWQDLCDESEEDALAEIKENGSIIDPKELSSEQKQEAIYNFIYFMYIVTITDDNPLGL